MINLKKIHNDILDRSIIKNFTLLPKNGVSTHEFDYKYCVSNIPELENYVFVVTKKMIYKNSSLVDFKRQYYIYDKEGNYINDDSIISKYQGFHKTLQEINEDLS